MKKAVVFSLLLTGWAGALEAQVINVEKFRLEGDSTGLVGNMGFGFSFVHQITDVLSLNSSANSAYLTENHGYMLFSNLNLIKVSQREGLVSQGYVHARVNFHRKLTVSPEVFAQVQYDAGRGLDSRRLIGSSLRLIVIRADFLTISASSGMMLESEAWREAGGNEDGTDRLIENHFWKSTWNVDVRWRISPVASFRMTTFYQARPEYFTEPRLIFDTQLVFRVSRRLGLGNQFVGTFDSRPIIEAGRAVYEIRSNFNWTFGK